MRYEKCVTCSRTVGWVGLAINLTLMLMKAFVGLISGSQALLADAMYSAKDLVSSLLVIVGLTVSSQPLDEEHPFGHGKVEFILSLIISVVFILVTGYLMVHAIQILLDDSPHQAPHLIALWAALVSIGVNIGMYYYSRCVAIEVNSPMVRTLAKHHYADATASGLVVVGITGSHYLDMPWIDTAVAVLETIHLMYLGAEVFWDSYKGLMDRSVDEDVLERIITVAERTDGVGEIKNLRTRYVGQEIWVEMTVGVSGDLTVDEAHDICDTLKERLIRRIPHVGTLHIDAEADKDDESLTAEMRAEWDAKLDDIAPQTEG